MTKSIGIFQIVIQAPDFAHMFPGNYFKKKKYACHEKFKMATIVSRWPTCPVRK